MVGDYIPSPRAWVADQVALYERSGGNAGLTLHDTGRPVIIVTNRGRKTGALRKTPLMRVRDGDRYILVASHGGAPEHPQWYYNLKAYPQVEIRDRTEVHVMRVREITNPVERRRLWRVAVRAFPCYADCQGRTSRLIPLFLAEPALLTA